MFRIVSPAARRTAVCSLGVATTMLLVACGAEDTAGRQPLGAGAAAAGAVPAPAADAPSALNATIPEGPVLSGEAKLALDAGNTAYRAKKYAEAIGYYRAAAAAAPTQAAPWFGVFMAANELKDQALADSAMARVDALSADAKALQDHGTSKPAVPNP